MPSTIPRTMQALRQYSAVPESALSDAHAIGEHVRLEAIPVPVPGPGQVLVKISRASMNPNDLYHLKGVYSATFDYPYPRGMGFEGAGVVVASGPGLIGKLRVGKRVMLYSKTGLFAEYAVVDAMKLMVLPDDVSFELAASSLANPLTGMGMAQWVKRSGSEYFFITAAAGAVARMTMRVAHSLGLKSIAIVRREEQAVICREEGASYVLNQSDADFEQQLTALCKKVHCTWGYDSIGGDMPLVLMRSMPQGSTLCMYGYFNTGPMQFQPQKVFNGWKLAFFEIEYYLADLSLLQRLQISRQLVRNINGMFKPKIQRQFALQDAVQAYMYYNENMTAGKVQVVADATL